MVAGAQQAIELTITADEAGERLDRILSKRPLGQSRSTLQAWIAAGRVELNGAIARASARPAAGATVRVRPAAPPPSELVPQDIPLRVLYEDADLLVLVKPAGLVTHPAPGHPDRTLANALRFRFGAALDGDPERPGIVHRLDRDTSGVMVVARRFVAREGLIGQFQRHDIEREYRAIAIGHVPERIRYETLHGRHPGDRKRFSSQVDRGKPAVTEVQRLERLHGASLVACRLETGRTHQIRVHLADHGHPILGDTVYGRTRRDPRLRAAVDALGRQALHARVLGFTHPTTGERMRFVAEPDEDFERAVALLRD